MKIFQIRIISIYYVRKSNRRQVFRWEENALKCLPSNNKNTKTSNKKEIERILIGFFRRLVCQHGK